MVGTPLSGLAFLPTILFCWICSQLRKRKNKEWNISGVTFFSWDTDHCGDDVPMYLWEKIGFATIVFLNVFGPIVFVIWYINVNHIPLVREDIDDPKVVEQGKIYFSIVGVIFLSFFLWIFGVFGKLKDRGAMMMKKILCWLGKHRWSYCYGSNQAYCEYCGKSKLKDKDVRSTMIRG